MHDKYYNQNFRIKTERALEIINRHEDTEAQYLLQLTKLRDQITNKLHCRMLREGEWNKMHLLKGTSQVYELIIPNHQNQWSSSFEEPILNFKLVIKNFTGAEIHLGFSNKAELIPMTNCEHKIVDDKIIKIRNYAKNTAKLYLTIHSPVDLTLFKLKYEFEVDNIKERARSLQSQSVKLIKINTRQVSSSKVIADNQREDLLLNLKKSNLSPRSIIKSRSDLQTARSKTIERQKQKIINAKIKKADLQLYREKNKSLKTLSNQCTSIFKEYQQQVELHTEKKEKTNKQLTLLLCATLFLRNLSERMTIEQHNLEEAGKKHKNIKRCAAKFMKLLQSLKMIQPRRLPRALLPVHHHLILSAKVYLKKDSQHARQIVAACLQNTLVAFSLNKAFNKCATYRAKVRMVQRFWLNRNKAQLTMLECYVHNQFKELLTKFPKFIVVKQQFYSRNMVTNLSVQYLKESSEKIRGQVATYRNKLKQIEDIKATNIEIDAFNKRSLKKHQKQFIEVPAKPCPPQCRYFRDLAILKSMVRSWLQIEYRRFVRKMQKQNQSPPTKGQPKTSPRKLDQK